jgi:hypothetical protein
MSKKNYVVCDGDKCRVCDAEITKEGLRCSDCEGLSHLGCTGLPTYALVYFALTRGVHVCATCVFKKESKQLSYQEACVKIEQLRDSEAEASRGQDPEQGASGAAGGVGPRLPAADFVAGPEVEARTLLPDKSGKVTPDICKHYLQKKCKHGRRGESCKFGHPKLCFRYLKFGRSAGSGCQKGSSCNYHHPRLCWEYSKRGECSRAECKFYHSKGGASAAVAPERGAGLPELTLVHQGKPDPIRGIGRAGALLGSRRRGDQSSAAVAVASAPGTESVAVAAERISEANFLLLLSQLQAQFHQMQSVMQALLARDAETARAKTPGTVWPREQVFSLPT